MLRVGHLFSSGVKTFDSTPGTVPTRVAMRCTRTPHSLLSLGTSIFNHVSTAARHPMISSLPTFIGRHTAPSHGLLLARAASIRSLRPRSRPLDCGPHKPLPPLNG